MDFNSWFVYDESSPSGIRWNVDRWSGEDYRVKRISVGEVAGTVSSRGYWTVILKKIGYRVHRVIWEMFNGSIPEGMQVDHINQDKSDNRISNLRLVTNSVNKRNSGKYKNNTSGVTGVRQITMSGILYWSATWARSDFTRQSAYYSVNTYGFEEAFKLACARRENEIKRRNEEGAQYSELHGK